MTPEPCVVCSGAGTIFCQSCAEFGNNDILQSTRWYCYSDCMAIDQLDHKKECPLTANSGCHKLLQRAKKAGEVAQALFYAFIENTWAYDMSNVRIVRDQGNDLVTIEVIAGAGVHCGPGGDSSCERYAGGWLIKFPHAAFRGEDSEAKQILLADLNSIWAFVFMHAVVQELFEDLVDDVEKGIREVVHYVADDVHRLVQHKSRFGILSVDRKDLVYPDYDGRGDTKGVYQITLKDNTKIILDLAGAQFNLPCKTVTYWDTYLNRWGNAVKYCVPLRSHYNKHVKKMSGYRCITHLTVIIEQMGFFNILVTHCEHELGFALKDLLTMDPEEFRNTEIELIRQAHLYLQKRPSDLDDRSQPQSMCDNFDLRHPKVIAKLRMPSANPADFPESLLHDISNMKSFDWDKLRDLVRMPASSGVKYKEKKNLRDLLTHRCVYKMPGSSRLIFLPDTLPSIKVPPECVSENPRWKG